jgi:deferrochelatase/peroxidase EfeB
MSDFQFNDMDGTPDLRDSALRSLQCNILRSTGRTACDQVFHRFSSKQAMADWLNTTPSPSPAHAGADRPYLINVLFTHAGLTRLGVSEGVLQQMDPAFRRGSRSLRTAEKLRDPMANKWDDQHKRPWHAVQLFWRSINEEPLKVSQGDGHEVHVEVGRARGRDGNPLKKDDEPRFNHFGIADAKSNPIYTGRDYDALLATKVPGADTNWKWDPRAKLSTLLVPDPLASHADCFGSYFVFRKFKEHVTVFRHKLVAIANTLIEQRGNGWWWKQYPAVAALTDAELRDLIAGLESKDPIHQALSNDAGVVLCQHIFGVGPDGQRPMGAADNNFDYADDAEGKKCPFSAHARAVNARGSRLVPQFERKTVIARRGISSDDGLLFWCAQASIGEQFEYIQEKWANASNVNLDHQATPGVDYLIGRTAGSNRGFDFDIRETVALAASEYLFAPSLMGFHRLCALGGV